METNSIKKDFLVRLLPSIIKNDDETSTLNTSFGVDNEEDNILYFYLSVVDITHAMIKGRIDMCRLPHSMFGDKFQDHPNLLKTDELLTDLKRDILKEIYNYENYKKSLNIE